MRERESLTRCLAVLGGGVVVATVLLVGVVLAVTLFYSEADKSNQSPSSGDDPLRVVALGDGFISGEGATGFFPGTDKPGRNQCRRTSTSFPYLLARSLEPPPRHDGVSLRSVACSGAATTNVATFADVACTDVLFPDGCPAPLHPYTAGGTRETRFQVQALTEETDVVLLMVGAQDAQVRDAIALCVTAADPCHDMLEPFAEAMGPMLDWRIGRVLSEVRQRSPGAALFVFTYPSLLGGRACGASRLDQDETEFINEQLLAELNGAIAGAATDAGAHLIDLSNALGGRRICSADTSGFDPAAEAFQVRPIRSISTKPSSWFHGSFYPNELGHRMISEVVTAELSRADLAPRSTSHPVAAPPVPFTVGPAESGQYRHDAPCDTRVVRHETMARPPDESVRIEGIDPGTSVCFRGLTGVWRTIEPTGAVAEVPVASGRDGLSGWSEVLYRSGGQWTRIVVISPAGPGTAELPLAEAWAWPWLVTVGGIVAHPIVAVTLIAMALGGALMWCARRPRPPKNEARRPVFPMKNR